MLQPYTRPGLVKPAASCTSAYLVLFPTASRFPGLCCRIPIKISRVRALCDLLSIRAWYAWIVQGRDEWPWTLNRMAGYQIIIWASWYPRRSEASASHNQLGYPEETLG